VDPSRLGVNIGAGLICADLNELSYALNASVEDGKFSLAKWGKEGMNNLTPLWLLKYLPNMLACHVTIVHDCQAPSNTITCGEASSHLAVGEAFRIIARGDADICICGGAESKINPMSLVRQGLMGRLVPGGDENPAEACRPFDVARRGMVVSEGGGLMILEELEHAKRRGARIYGEVVGFGAASSAKHWLRPDPDGRSQALAMTKALADAGVTPDGVGLVNAFGIAMKEHDLSEAAAIRQVFGANGRTVPVLATKGAIGNNGAGSGAIDLAVTTMALNRGVVPPSLNTEQMDPACGLNVVRGDPIDCRADCAVSIARALCGGQSAALVIRRYHA